MLRISAMHGSAIYGAEGSSAASLQVGEASFALQQRHSPLSLLCCNLSCAVPYRATLLSRGLHRVLCLICPPSQRSVDPNIAPTLPSIQCSRKAARVLCWCVSCHVASGHGLPCLCMRCMHQDEDVRSMDRVRLVS